MPMELFRARRAKSVKGEARGIIDQQAYWPLALGRSEDSPRAIGLGQVGDRLDRARRDGVAFVMNMGDHRPAIVEQASDNSVADPFSAACDDCRSAGFAHGNATIILLPARLHRGSNAGAPPATRSPWPQPGRTCGSDRSARRAAAGGSVEP